MANHGTIFSHPVFVETILPFVLIFTIVFAILQKSKILGDGKKQIDAIVALVIGLLVISFAQATGLIITLIPFLAVSLVVILIFMLLVGSFHKDSDFLPKGVKTFLLILVAVALVIALLIITNVWQFVIDLIFIGSATGVLINVIFIVIIIAAVVAVIWGSKSKKDKD